MKETVEGEKEFPRQAYLRTIFEGATIGIALLDLNGAVLHSNPAWQALAAGAAAHATAGAAADIHHFISAADRPLHAQHFAELARGEREGYELELRRHIGGRGPAWVRLTLSLLRDEAGAPYRAIAMAQDVSERRAVAAELQELKRHLARSEEEQRTRLAQELHDGPLQDLYAARYRLKGLQAQAKDAAAARQFTAVEERLQQVSDTLRAICNDLRPPALAPFGLEAAIRSHAEQFQQSYPDLRVTLDLTPDSQALPEYLRLALYRVYQEMLSNVARHAEATDVLVRFAIQEKEVLLEIQDNGVGFEVPERWIELARRGHLGLLGASERIEEIDGRLLILSASGQGTIVRVRAPRMHEHAPMHEEG